MTPIGPKAVAASKEVLRDLPNSIQTEKGPVLRMWKGRSTVERGGEYVRHATKKVFPALRAIEGHRGAYLLRRIVDGAIEFVVLTLWDSMAAVRRFAGAQPDMAVVEAEARAILTSFDDRVTHYEIVQGTERAEDERPSRS
jgi:heme-degrading monooxygenase HmoA